MVHLRASLSTNSQVQILISTSKTPSHITASPITMSPRYFVTVSDTEDNMVEEEHYLCKTTRGMKAAKKQVPKTKPKAPPV